MRITSNFYSTKLQTLYRITRKGFKPLWIFSFKLLQLSSITTNSPYSMNHQNNKESTTANSKDISQQTTSTACWWLLTSSWRRPFYGIMRRLRMDWSMRTSRWRQVKSTSIAFWSCSIGSYALISSGKSTVSTRTISNSLA